MGQGKSLDLKDLPKVLFLKLGSKMVAKATMAGNVVAVVSSIAFRSITPLIISRGHWRRL